MLNKHHKRASGVIGFMGSLIFHSALFGLVLWLIMSKKTDFMGGAPAEVMADSFSIQLLQAMVLEEPEPTPEPEPELKEEIPDPTVKPDPPKEKPKPKPPKPKPKPKKILPKAKQEVVSNSTINSVSSSPSPTTDNPNLVGKGQITADEKRAYLSAVRREIERKKNYPRKAKIMRHQGVVMIGFSIETDGRLSNAHIVSSSGWSELDNAAIKAVQSANSSGSRPNGINPSQVIPIRFSIKD